MNVKFILTWIAISLTSLIVGFLTHAVLLHGDYAQIASLMRTPTEGQAYFPLLMIVHDVKGFAFAWIYRQGISADTPWLTQGLRFGLALSLLMPVSVYLTYYVVQPMPGMLVAKQIIFDSIGTIIMALVAAFINRSPVGAGIEANDTERDDRVPQEA